mmetsp:Transcript_3683/g.8288  ORF Transcript_3683/g.8288 Transcript_3683/m.8288 type:complete len:222 (+) Transcript_3683:129-794(+)
MAKTKIWAAATRTPTGTRRAHSRSTKATCASKAGSLGSLMKAIWKEVQVPTTTTTSLPPPPERRAPSDLVATPSSPHTTGSAMKCLSPGQQPTIRQATRTQRTSTRSSRAESCCQTMSWLRSKFTRAMTGTCRSIHHVHANRPCQLWSAKGKDARTLPTCVAWSARAGTTSSHRPGMPRSLRFERSRRRTPVQTGHRFRHSRVRVATSRIASTSTTSRRRM